LLMYTTEPIRSPTVWDLMVDAAKLRPRHPLEPGATRIDLSLGARDAILRSPLIHRTDAGFPGREPFDLSSRSSILGIPIFVDPELPDNIVVFRDREGNILHPVALAG
jgi:hypothetical protein